MLDAQIIEGLELKFNALAGDLDDRGRKRWAASESLALGYGGITAVAKATGLSRQTIHKGIHELNCDDPLPSTRQRRHGGGRKPLEVHQPDLIEAIDRLVEPTERGDPQSPLRWTCKSLTNLQDALRRQGIQVGLTKISGVLRLLGANTGPSNIDDSMLTIGGNAGNGENAGLVSIAVWEGTSFALQWGPAGGLRGELHMGRLLSEWYGTGWPSRWQRSMVAW